MFTTDLALRDVCHCRLVSLGCRGRSPLCHAKVAYSELLGNGRILGVFPPRHARKLAIYPSTPRSFYLGIFPSMPYSSFRDLHSYAMAANWGSSITRHGHMLGIFPSTSWSQNGDLPATSWSFYWGSSFPRHGRKTMIFTSTSRLFYWGSSFLRHSNILGIFHSTS